jgi:ribosomal protein S18 acetylase RimI-like enzyme
MIHFEPMTQEEFSDYTERSIESYARTSPRFRGMEPAAALEEVRKEYASQVMPQGFKTPGQLLFTLWNAEARVGYLHLGEIKPGSKTLHAWDFMIFEPYRGQGLGRQAMLAASERLKPLGYTKITLNVMGDNAVARHLYESFGFHVTQIQMAREIQ